MTTDTVTWTTTIDLPKLALPATVVLGVAPAKVVDLNNGSQSPAAGQEGFVTATLTARKKTLTAGVLAHVYTLTLDDTQLVGGGPIVSADIVNAFAVDTRRKHSQWQDNKETLGALVALGNSQGTAAPLSARVTAVTGADAVKGAILPASPTPGDEFELTNVDNAVLLVYPGSGDAIDAGAADAPVSVAARAKVRFRAASTSLWYSDEAPAA